MTDLPLLPPGPEPGPVVLFTTLGPNPAPLTELLWALARHHHRLVVEVHVVVAQRGLHFLERELLPAGGPLDELVALLGEDLAHGPSLHIHLARLPDGTPIEDDDDPIHAEAYHQAVWQAARAAQEAAGERPLIFALAAGRRRTMVATLTMAFQMLARPQDDCLDVRVDLREAEGGSGFFFPEQARPTLYTERGPFEAREVEVQLVPVLLPRLRGLINLTDLTSAATALGAVQQVVQRVALPTLRVDLGKGECLVDGHRLPLSQSQFLWYATLAIERHKGGEGWAPANAPVLFQLLQGDPVPSWLKVEELPDIFQVVTRKKTPSKSLGGENNLRSLRSKTGKVVRDFCQHHRISHDPMLAPVHRTIRKQGVQRIELPAERIEIHDPGGLLTPRGP